LLSSKRAGLSFGKQQHLWTDYVPWCSCTPKRGYLEADVEMLPDLMDLLAALAASNVKFLIVGGWAVSFHSEPRFTKDLDILIG
jgi:hypothetical protein